MNIASAPTTPACSPSAGALSSFTKPQTNGNTSQGTALLDAFLSLLTSLAPQVGDGPDGDTNAADAGRKDDRKEFTQGAFAPLQVLQAGANFPVAGQPVPLVNSFGFKSTAQIPSVIALSDRTAVPASAPQPSVEPGGSENANIPLVPLTISSPLQQPNRSADGPLAFAVRLKEVIAQPPR